MSDYNSSIKKSSVVARSREFRDLDLSLAIHPIRRDIVPLKDLDAINNSVRNIIFSNYYEKPYGGHWIAGDLRSKLFELADMFTVISIKTAIESALKKYEQRIVLEEVSVLDRSERNGYEVTIQYRIKSTSESEITKLYLKRLR